MGHRDPCIECHRVTRCGFWLEAITVADNAQDQETISLHRASAPAYEARSARLQVVYPNELVATIPLSRPKTVLGRSPSDPAMPKVAHPTVSRNHLTIDWSAEHESHEASDLGSRNGSWIDGVECGSRTILHDGAVLRIGDVLCVYEHLPPLPKWNPAPVSREAVFGDAAATEVLRRLVAGAAPDPSPVLLIGPTGTGKEWIAREIHRVSGRAGPLVTINCATLSAQIIESQLFGHVRGAFTGAASSQEGLFRAADTGTLFLDEIGELPLHLQPKLLRALQEGEVLPVGGSQPVTVDVRVIAATNRELRARVEADEFRRDLYARLALWELRLSPLCQRRADILAWTARLHRRWLDERVTDMRSSIELEPDAAERLLLYDWPENLRGLDRLIHEVAARRSDEGPIACDQLPDWLPVRSESPLANAASAPAAPAAAAPAPAAPNPDGTKAKRKAPSRDEFIAAFEALDGNVRALARHFERDRRQIYRWIKTHGIKR